MPQTLYFDNLSQPCRSAWILLKLNKVAFEPKEMELMKGQHKEESFKSINPFTMLPFLDDGGFRVIESVAILKYLVAKNKLADKWYPKDLQKQTRVEEYLRWYPSNTRKHCVDVFLNLVLFPKMSGKPVDQEAVKEAREKVKQMVSETESYFLKGKKFIAGDEISIADLLGVCELVQLYGCHEQGLYESSPVVKAWVDRVREACNPAFEESMAKINEIHKTFLSDKK